MFRYAVPLTGARHVQKRRLLALRDRLLSLQAARPGHQPEKLLGFFPNTFPPPAASIREASTRRGVMVDSRLDPTRFQARGPTRVGSLPPRPGRASQGRSMTSGLAAMSCSGQGRVPAGYWNVGSREEVPLRRVGLARFSKSPVYKAERPGTCGRTSARKRNLTRK